MAAATQINVVAVRHIASGRGMFYDASSGVPLQYRDRAGAYDYRNFELVTQWIELCQFLHSATDADYGLLFSRRNELFRQYAVPTNHILMDHEDCDGDDDDDSNTA